MKDELISIFSCTLATVIFWSSIKYQIEFLSSIYHVLFWVVTHFLLIGIFSVSPKKLFRLSQEEYSPWSPLFFVPINTYFIVQMNWRYLAMIYVFLSGMFLLKRLWGMSLGWKDEKIIEGKINQPLRFKK